MIGCGLVHPSALAEPVTSRVKIPCYGSVMVIQSPVTAIPCRLHVARSTEYSILAVSAWSECKCSPQRLSGGATVSRKMGVDLSSCPGGHPGSS